MIEFLDYILDVVLRIILAGLIPFFYFVEPLLSLGLVLSMDVVYVTCLIWIDERCVENYDERIKT